MADSTSLSSVILLLWSKMPSKLITLSGLKTNQQRIEFVYSNQLFDDVLDISPRQNHGKSAVLSEQLRREGNKMFKLKRYEEALEKYNQCLLLAPFPSPVGASNETEGKNKDGACTEPPARKEECASTESSVRKEDCASTEPSVRNKGIKAEHNASTDLAVAFSNRSAVLFHLEKYRSCLNDIQHSMDQGYPSDLLYKLYDRAARCHLALHHWEEASKAFKKCLDSLESSNLQSAKKQRWASSVSRELEKICEVRMGSEEADPGTCPSLEFEIPSVTGGSHCHLLNASDSVLLQRSETVGRYMVSRTPLRLGDVVCSEQPFAAALHTRFLKSHCSQCHIAVPLPYPCWQCTEVIYCSRQCQQAAWPLHKVECMNLSLLTEPWVYKLGHVALRSVVSAPCHLLQSADVLEHSGDESTDYARFCQLVTHEEARDADSNIHLVAMAVYLTKVLVAVGFLHSLDEQMVCRHVLHALQVVQCNGIAVTQMSNADDFHLSKPELIGQAVCLTMALANHSCDPNMELCFYGSRCVSRVIKPVKAGDQLCYDYGQVFILQPKADRQTYLRANYFFTCACVACELDWPLFDQMNDARLLLRCADCGRPLTSAAGVDESTCAGCGGRHSVTGAIKQLAESHDRYVIASKQVSSGYLTEGLPVLTSHLELLYKLICQPWKEFYSCQATVRQCYRLLGAKYGLNLGQPR